MFQPVDDPFSEMMARHWQYSRFADKETRTDWLRFRKDRIDSFVREAKAIGFVLDGSGFSLRGLGWISWAASPFHKEDGTTVDAVWLSGMYTYACGKGHGTIILKCLLRAMNETDGGIFAFLVPRAFSLDKHGEVVYSTRQGTLDDDQLRQWYMRHGFQDSGEVSDEGRNILSYVSRNYKPNPYPHETTTNEDEQGKGVGCVINDDAAATRNTHPHSPAHLDPNRLAYYRTHAREW